VKTTIWYHYIFGASTDATIRIPPYAERSILDFDDSEANVRIDSNFFKLYTKTAHFQMLISFEDYSKIFETIWRDRARQAGWDIDITYDDGICFIQFTRDN